MVNYKLLWIEDDAIKIMGLVRPLIQDGYQVDTALDVEKAKQRLKEKKYDLIILDIILPSGKKILSKKDFETIEKFNGLKFLESLPTDSPPILVLSVVNDEEIIAQVESFPQVKKYLIKGMIKPSQLKEEVMEILEMKSK